MKSLLAELNMRYFNSANGFLIIFIFNTSHILVAKVRIFFTKTIQIRSKKQKKESFGDKEAPNAWALGLFRTQIR